MSAALTRYANAGQPIGHAGPDAPIHADERIALADLLNFARALRHGLRMGYSADELLRDGGSLRARLDAVIDSAIGEHP